jgi:hypothetical protein
MQKALALVLLAAGLAFVQVVQSNPVHKTNTTYLAEVPDPPAPPFPPPPPPPRA